MKTTFLKAAFCASVLLVSSTMASGLSFPEKVQCTTATDCSIKASGIKRPTDAGTFIALELKALEQLNYKKQKKGQYSDSKDALRKMVALFIDGSAAMPGVFGGWMIQTDRSINFATGALLLAYEVEENRSEDPNGIDWVADYQSALVGIKNAPDYKEMKALSSDPKKLSAALLEEAKARADIVR